jgi:DNA-binding NtrC family response regulator
MSAKKRVLVAEDDKATHEEWSESLTTWGYEVAVAEDGDRALELIRTFSPHIFLCDLKMPKRDGLELLKEIQELGLELSTIIISGEGQIPEAVQAIKLGALDYLRKPIDPHHLKQILKTLSENIAVREENLLLRRRLMETGELGTIFGKSLAMRRVMNSIERLAGSSASVIISGESGTGKELAARTIHELSPRRGGAYIGVNCAAIPETLMESELFGYERGAFTGADRRKEGSFELANHGTLLLDEITEMKIELQAKLLRVIEEQRLRRVGGTTEIPLDVRVLAASNRDIERAVKEGKLREDLFYRLGVFTIQMPPLRDRVEDIPLLIDAFLNFYAEREHKPTPTMDDECREVLKTHPWPGNVRQLRNVIERALIVYRGSTITTADLPPDFRTLGQTDSGYFQVRLGTSLDDVERELIVRTIEFAGGNKTRAAEILGVAPKTLYNRLERYEER